MGAKTDISGSDVSSPVSTSGASSTPSPLPSDRSTYAGRLTVEITTKFLLGSELAFVRADNPSHELSRRTGILLLGGEITLFNFTIDHGRRTLQVWVYDAQTGEFLRSSSRGDTNSGVVPLSAPDKASGETLLQNISYVTRAQNRDQGSIAPKGFQANNLAPYQSSGEFLTSGKSGEEVVSQSSIYAGASGVAEGLGVRSSAAASLSRPLLNLSNAQVVNLSYRLNFDALTGARRVALGNGLALSGNQVLYEGLMVPNSITDARASAYDAYLAAWERALATATATVDSAGQITSTGFGSTTKPGTNRR